MLEKLLTFKAIVATAATIVTISSPGIVSAQSQGETELLAELAEADAEAATRLERELRNKWDKSGSATMDLLLRRGQDAIDRGELRVAMDHLTALVDHAPEFASGWLKRSEVFARMDQFGPAVADLERALALNPNDYDALYILGTVFEHFLDPKKAYEAYRRAKAIHPHHKEVTTALERLAPIVMGKEL
ncbi:hypothetical protein KMP13_09925 [Epibacterium ulvae]|uniref:tetratricopeptide repeat protein n=1 Tax=Epibacterium ulvae TaxID=1156985 RepID=UPI001BFC31A5|nr:tetratricopeptide repeat protein [Epibacterium ulvae]MBT8154208.1 hypothetical protein [Epibacterium ulvae]